MDVRPRTFRMILISLQMMWIGHRPMVIGRSATRLCAIGQCCHVEEDNITPCDYGGMEMRSLATIAAFSCGGIEG